VIKRSLVATWGALLLGMIVSAFLGGVTARDE